MVELLRDQPYRAGELAERVGVSPAALSRHLRTLKAEGLIEEIHPPYDARVRIYALKAGAMAGLKAWVDETEQLWADQLAALKAHVEAPR
ncbi:MAG: ArsR family transcriptional regulator [Sphingomonas bacterium]|nr:ArsR family transcriptional regulator [Sphingomonas bacterium]